MSKTRTRQRVNRYRFTINNPFITEDVKVLSLDNLTDEQKELYERSYNRNDFAHLKDQPYFDFAVCEYSQKEYGEVFSKVVAERIFFKDYQTAQEYFKKIDFIDYVCFQYEQGALGTKHLQGFMHFNRQMDFKVVCAIFPTIHLDRCTDSNSYCIDYCKKPETKIDGFDFFEHGTPPADERTRPDMQEFNSDIKNFTPFEEMLDKYTFLTVQQQGKIDEARQRLTREKYKNVIRDVHITYIYGKENAGKTTYAERVLGYEPMEICTVGDYDHSGKFDNYDFHDVILFDEFDSQIPITKMNTYLSGRPLSLPARNTNRFAVFTKVFIVSNYPLESLYKKERDNGKEPSFKGFLRRINEVIYMPDRNVYIWQKGNPTPEVIAKLTEQGAKYTLMSQTAEQIELIPVNPDDLPF